MVFTQFKKEDIIVTALVVNKSFTVKATDKS